MGFGLALAGGGCRGAAHVGVLLALEEEGVIPTSIAGTSAGSLVGGLYASGIKAPQLRDVIHHLEKEGFHYLDFDIWELLKIAPGLLLKETLTIKGLIKGNRLLKYFRELTHGAKIKDLKLLTVIPAVDLNSGDTIVFTNGSAAKHYNVWGSDLEVCEAMMASSSVPAVFKPRRLGPLYLVDGGVTHNLPVGLLHTAGENNIIAVDISETYVTSTHPTIIDIVTQSFAIMSNALKDCSAAGECLLLKPPLPKEAGLLTFEYMSECMNRTYEYTKEMMPQIRKWQTNHF